MMASHEVIDRAGAGAPWLVMLHGFSQDRRAFSAQVDAFGHSYRLLLVDLPGHGGSSAIAGPYGHAELAAAVDAVILHVTGPKERLLVWGTHTGAAIALLLAARNPARFDALVLEGAVLPGRPMASVTDAFARMTQVLADQGIEAARQAWFETSPWFAVMRADPFACRADAQCRMIDGFDGRPWREPGTPAAVNVNDAMLAGIDLPVLLYNGEHDVPDFTDVARHLERVLPRVTRMVIARGGGFPGWEFPDAVNRAVADFLAHRGSRPACEDVPA